MSKRHPNFIGYCSEVDCREEGCHCTLRDHLRIDMTAIEAHALQHIVCDAWEEITNWHDSHLYHYRADRANGIITGLWFAANIIGGALNGELSLLRNISLEMFSGRVDDE